MPAMILKANRDRNRPLSKMPRAQLMQALEARDRIAAISTEIRERHGLPPVSEGETCQGARRRLAEFEHKAESKGSFLDRLAKLERSRERLATEARKLADDLNPGDVTTAQMIAAAAGLPAATLTAA